MVTHTKCIRDSEIVCVFIYVYWVTQKVSSYFNAKVKQVFSYFK